MQIVLRQAVVLRQETSLWKYNILCINNLGRSSMSYSISSINNVNNRYNSMNELLASVQEESLCSTIGKKSFNQETKDCSPSLHE